MRWFPYCLAGLITSWNSASTLTVLRGSRTEWTSTSCRRRLSLPDHDTLTLMFAGSHGVSDGLDVMIDAASRLWRWGRHGGSRYAGDSSGTVRISATMINADCPARVDERQLRGSCSRSRQIYERLSEADAFVVSRFETSPCTVSVSASTSSTTTWRWLDQPWIRDGITMEPVRRAAVRGSPFALMMRTPSRLAYQQLLSMSRTEREAMGARGRAFVQEGHDFHVLGGKLEQVLQRATEV